MLPVNIRVLGLAIGSPLPMVAWLASFDPEARDGRGNVVLTTERKDAMQFADAAEALRVYQSSPKCHPIRETDGRPNRPLTAYHVEIVRTDTEPLGVPLNGATRIRDESL